MTDPLSSLENEVSSSWNSISSAGAPAVIAGVENYAASQLTQDASQEQSQSQAAVQAAVKAGGTPSPLMQSIQNVFGQIAQGTVFKQYGLYIVGGAIIAVILIRRI